MTQQWTSHDRNDTIKTIRAHKHDISTMTSIDELKDLTVDEQKDELEDLTHSELEKLKEKEDRNTALDNIEREMNSRIKPAKEETDVNNPHDQYVQRITQLENKVAYLIDRCKTTSEEGFQDYRGDE